MPLTGGGKDEAAFVQALSSLKRNGSSLFIVGDTSQETHVAACNRLIGRDDERPRRFFVRPTGDSPCSVEPDDPSRTIDGDVLTRSAVASQPSPAPLDDITPMRIANDTIETLDLGAIDDDTGQIRVCIDSFLSMLDTHPESDVFHALHTICGCVSDCNGVGHVHVPLPRSHDVVETMSPLFDAIIEVRTGSDGPEHCCYLRDQDVTSGWLPL